MIFSKKQHDGYLMVDHRASPGIPEDMARKMGLDPANSRGGKLAEYATLGCPHCGSHIVLNPDRTRDREWCAKCDKYICDWCGAARKETGYVHRSMDELRDLVKTEKYVVSGPVGRPIITLR